MRVNNNVGNAFEALRSIDGGVATDGIDVAKKTYDIKNIIGTTAFYDKLTLEQLKMFGSFMWSDLLMPRRVAKVQLTERLRIGVEQLLWWSNSVPLGASTLAITKVLGRADHRA